MNTQDKIFRLYALSAKEPSEDVATKYQFVRITPKYSLVYTADEQPENSVEIGMESLYRLSPEDKQWLTDCVVVMLAQDVSRKEAECLAQLGEKVAELEKALQAARAEIPQEEKTEETQIE